MLKIVMNNSSEELGTRWRSTTVLKRDVFSTIERGRFCAERGEVDAVLRHLDAVPWWSRLVARELFRRERRALAIAGLHPATGGDGQSACSADMLLEALVGCAGVTLSAVATALGIPLRDATIRAEGDLDFRGTLGVDKEAPVGFAEIRLRFEVATDAPQDKLDLLLKLTERYCVVYQTIRNGPKVSVSMKRI